MVGVEEKKRESYQKENVEREEIASVSSRMREK